MKKQQGAINLFQAQQATGQHNVGSGSDSDPSPSFTSPEYLTMMQHWAPEQGLGNGMNMPQTQQYQDHRPMHGLPLGVSTNQFSNYAMAQHLSDDAFNGPEEMNRRTMTQEQFDAMARGGGAMNGPNDFANFPNDFAADAGMWNTVFPDVQGNDIKPQEAYTFPHSMGAPLSSYDSTVPSTISDQSMPPFPSSNQMQNRAALSASSSEWSGSRSSSICVSQAGESMMQLAQQQQQQQQATAATSQWQPGQSVPVDFNALNEEFRQAAQARDRQAQIQEQPLAWPSDDAYARRDSQASNMLAHGLSNVGINTPQPAQTATFKSPAPPANIAARRQRRPAPIGLAAMRSQSYSGAVPPPISPGQAQQQNLAAGQQLRRIRSSNMINGGVAHGRVMKSASAQRSPLSWTFADALNSPRHVSGQGSLAPPTPMTPNEFPGQENGSQFPSWHASSGHATRHPSINESELEHELPYPPSASVPAQNFSSPPHTPSYYQQQFVQQRVGNNVIMENTPPQSAPASQMCFPSSAYSQPLQQPQHQQPLSQPYAPASITMSSSQSQQGVSSAPSQPSNLQNVTFAPTQHAPVTSGPPPGVPLQFANGIPMVDEEGNITMAFPDPMQFLPEQQQAPAPAPQMPTPPQYPYMVSGSASPNAQITAQLPRQSQQPAQELFVHEYSPPEELKRSVTPRKAVVDSGPKNYTFANSGPEHWEKQAKKAEAKAASATASNSPAGSSTSAP